MTLGDRGMGKRKYLSIVSYISSFTTCFPAVAEALLLTSRVELNNNEESKCPISRSILINFRWLIRPLVGYHLNHYSPDVLCFFFVFALISNFFSWRQLHTKTETEHSCFAKRLVLFFVFNSIISIFEWSSKTKLNVQ